MGNQTVDRPRQRSGGLRVLRVSLPVLFYRKTGLREIEDRFRSIPGIVNHLAERAIHTQENDIVAGAHLTRIEIGAEGTLIIGTQVIGTVGETDHFLCRRTGKLETEYQVFTLLIGGDKESFGPFIDPPDDLGGERGREQE
jgi:hypothetical protein